MLTEANEPARHLDRPLRSWARLPGRPANSPQADSEFDRCIKRRGEALSLFLDEEPTYAYFPPVHYYQARARGGAEQRGVRRVVSDLPQFPWQLERRLHLSSKPVDAPHLLLQVKPSK